MVVMVKSLKYKQVIVFSSLFLLLLPHAGVCYLLSALTNPPSIFNAQHFPFLWRAIHWQEFKERLQMLRRNYFNPKQLMFGEQVETYVI